MEMIVAAFLAGILVGVTIVPLVVEIRSQLQQRKWRKAGEQWARTYERATEASEFFGELPPSDSLVEDIRERVRESNILPEHERKEHDARIEQIEEDAEKFVEMHGLNACWKPDPEKCDHDYYEVHPSMGDASSPTGKRCRKCNNQVWY